MPISTSSIYFYPLLLWALDGTYRLGYYRSKIVQTVKQWAFVLDGTLPSNHFQRLLTAAALFAMHDWESGHISTEQTARMLLRTIDYDKIPKECNLYSYTLRCGMCGFLWMLEQIAPSLPDEDRTRCFRAAQRIRERDVPPFLSHLERIESGQELLNLFDGLAGAGIACLKRNPFADL